MKNSARPALNKFIVPMTIMLSFVSFWRAAAIVLSDLGSSAYYVGGIAEKAIGKAAPWFILAIMLFSYAVRAVYIESCSMFVRGGVYRVVREAMGSTAAKFSVSALMFDYVLTGPISAVSAGLYLAGLINESGKYFGISWMHVPTPLFAVALAILVTLYFWHTNRVGIPFSSTRALRIMQITTVMVVALIIWCVITIFTQGYQPVPPPTLANLKFSDESLGWLRGTIAPSITIIAILIGLGHSLLAMSGEESLAQVNREIAAPKHQNLIRTGLVIFIYSLVFTSLVSFFAVMIIPDAERSQYFDNLISGISIFLVGPILLKLAFHAFVVLVGTLILSGAVNTAIIGANGVLNRVAEDKARSTMEEGEIKRFRLEVRENLSPTSLQVRPGNVLVAVHDPNSLRHLGKVLEEIDPKKVDVVVLSVNLSAPEESRDLARQAEQVVDNYETLVFSRVVHIAEKTGKPVSLVAVAGKKPYDLILQAGHKLRSSRIVMGLSSAVSASEQQQEIRHTREQLPAPRPTVTVEIVREDDQAPIQIDLGSPLPRL